MRTVDHYFSRGYFQKIDLTSFTHCFIEATDSSLDVAEPMEGHPSSSRREELRQQLAEGLLYIHSRLSENTKSTLEAASFLYALVELLSEQGLLSIDEMEERKREVA